jgi:hypothetical protein
MPSNFNAASQWDRTIIFAPAVACFVIYINRYGIEMLIPSVSDTAANDLKF